MKNKTAAKILSAIIITVVALSLTLSVSAAIPRSEEELMNSIFFLLHTDGDNSIVTSAFYAEDPVSGVPYIVTTSTTSSLNTDYAAYVLGTNDYCYRAEYVGSDDYFSFYKAPYLEGRTAMTVADNFPYELSICIIESDGNDGYRLDGDYYDTREGDWVDCDYYRYWDGEQIQIEWLGAPVFDNNNGTVVGCVTMTEDECFAVVSAESISFPAVTAPSVPETSPYVTETPETTPETSAPETTAAPEAETNEPERSNLDGGTILLVVAGVVGAGALVYGNNKKKSSDKASSSSSVENGTIPLEVKEITQPESYQSTAPEQTPVSPVNTIASWQVRGIGGSMEGKVFLLGKKLSFGRNPECDVTFSLNAPGISSLHCELDVIDGRVVLRDMRSTFGTYLCGNVKMEPSVNYYLNAGDEFTLAEGSDTFRLEPAGAYKTELTPAVKSVDGIEYRADLDGKITFGRNPASRVHFDASDISVSGQHCILYKEGDDLFLMDTNSTNGTFFSENERLKPNTPYKVGRGVSFFLSSPKNTFVITED